VSSGRFKQAEFAADMAQVLRGTAEVEYQDPVEFFNRTYLTVGISQLLADGLKRLAGEGGEPVIQVKTAFGGGKTHAMLSLYHLLRAPKEVAKLDHRLRLRQICEHLSPQALARELDDDGQPSEFAPVTGAILHEVVAPHVPPYWARHR